MSSRNKSNRRKSNSTRRNTISYNKNSKTTRTNSNYSNTGKDVPRDISNTSRVATVGRRSNKTSSSNNLFDRRKGNTNKSTGPIRKGSELKNRKKKNNKNRKNNKKIKIIKRIILTLVLLFLLLFLIIGGVVVGVFFSDKFAITKEDLLISNSNTVIYDSEGNVILELSGDENRKIISIDDMSPYLPNAFVAIEDERFYKHHGVDLKRTAAATATYLVHAGSSNFGGSTITQQLVKNITNEKESTGKAGMQRKVKEMSRAYQIEKMIDKKQILQLYLNLIPLASSGGDICGVEMASIYYFNKSAKDLSIEECAFIAGVTHSPALYNPYKENPNTDKINNRTKTVLGKMKKLKYITEDEYKAAIAKVDEGLKFQQGVLPSSNIKSYFVKSAVDQVINDLVEQKGMSREYAESRVFNGGLKIYTTQLAAVQNAIDQEYKSDKFVKPSNQKEGQHTQSAMVIIDNKTGRVVGCAGGLGTDVDAIGVNRIESVRQPGSSIKPIGVYGPALEKGIITAATVYDNSKTTFGKTYSPDNASSSYSGLCTVRQALEVSSNIVACKVITELTPDAAIDFMRQLGITSLVKDAESTNGVSDSNTSLALGTAVVSPLEMAAAYATIANDGVYIEPTFYLKVEDSAGNVILEPDQETRKVLNEGTCFVLKSLLKQVVEGQYGTAKACKMANMDVAAKTGTTQKQNDLWLCGFTPYYTGATWFGYDYAEYVSNAGGSPATLIWANVMKNIHSQVEGRRFKQPSNVVSAKVCNISGKCATSACTNTHTEFFVEGTVPTQCTGHSSYTICEESGKIATEYCTKTKTVNGITAPEKEQSANWKTNSGNKYSAITEKCTIHTAENSKKEENKNENKTTVTNTDIKVPNVVGKSESEALKALSGIKVVKDYKSDPNKPNGTVLSQSHGAGSVVSKEATITIVINKVTTQQNNEGNNNGSNSGNNTGNNTGNNSQNSNNNQNKSENQNGQKENNN